jgi:probable phosphoglycerate mutase
MFVIVRHGNTFAAAETPRRIGARTDLPLTGKGREQAQALAAHFVGQGWHFSRALVSPLLRTRETASLILAAQGGEALAEPCPWLREIDHGPDENQPEETVLARIGAEALAAWERRAVPPPDWQVDAAMRLHGWRELFASNGEQGATLLVTSNGAARFALMADPALAAAMDRLDSLKLPTGGYGVIRRDGDSGLVLAAWGLRP